MQAPPSKSTLQLLLFVDDRPSARELVKEMEQFLQRDRDGLSELKIINVSGQPQLAELFRVVMTPTLVKVTPLPRQTIAGKNLLSQLETCWNGWHTQAALDVSAATSSNLNSNLANSSELIRLADEVFRLKQDKADLEEQVRFKDRIITILAHDLRNPLTAVSLALETVEVSGERLTQQLTGQLLNHARSQVKIVDSMITNILEASRGNGSEFHMQLGKVRLDKLCESVLNDFFLLNCIESKHQTLVKDIPDDLPRVYADEEKVRQILMNLIGNAIKYTPMGGKISVVALHRTAQKVEVSVTDNGPGVPPEMRDRIFEHQYRLERDGTKEGYGIGLALCKRIIRAHYGQIWVDSPGKEGSCFHFTLPVY